MAPPRPRGLLADIGGTLVREDSYDLSAGVRALEPLRAVDALIQDLQDSIAHVHANNSSEFTVAHWLASNQEYFPKRSLLELELALFGATARLSPMPGVAQALLDLRKLGLKIACLSNAVFCGRALHAELERHGLEVDFVISSADLAIRKPDARVFAAALSRMSLPSSAVWFVGESWAADICGAANAGLFPVWLSQSEEPPPARPDCARVTSWDELLALVARSLAT